MSTIPERVLWRPVMGDYEVSRYGWVRNARSGVVLTPGTNRGGYLFVNLTVDGVRFVRKVHGLVMEAFCTEERAGRDVNHKDGVKSHNHIDNLEYLSRGDNLRHAFALGLKTHKGEANPKSKYTQQQVDEVRSYLWQGCKHRDIATHMKVPMHLVADVSARRNWV